MAAVLIDSRKNECPTGKLDANLAGPKGLELRNASNGPLKAGFGRTIHEQCFVATASACNRFANPTWVTVRDIAAALGVSIGELANSPRSTNSPWRQGRNETPRARNAPEPPGSQRHLISTADRANRSAIGKARNS